MSEEEPAIEDLEVAVESEEDRIARELKDNDGWYQDGEQKVIPLKVAFKSGHGMISEMRLSDPGGFQFEKLGDPYTILSSTGKISLEGDGDDKEIKFEMNRKKLNRYVESSNTPQLGFGEARLISTKDVKAVHSAMMDFF